MKAAIYARYSSDNQRDASIDDQVRVCTRRIDAENWQLVDTYADHGISGASTLRPKYQQMLMDARTGRFDVLIAEALDRLSRDQEDIAALYKQLCFADVRLITLAEGEISELHIGLKGTMNALFLKDLADKTRRGLEGRVRQGKSGGGNAYGYTVFRKMAADGTPIRGEREINTSEAAVVRRIFEEFAIGRSPTAIAKTLNAESIPGPRGGAWQDTAIRGHQTRGTGVLNNELYIGRLVWNRLRYVKDPSTGKRLSRANPPEEWVIANVPDLQIIPDELWHRVKSRQSEIAGNVGVCNAKATRFWEARRPRHLLTGKIACGCCGKPLASVGRDYLGCNRARKQGTCSNGRSIRRDIVENEMMALLQDQLMQPIHVDEFITAYNRELSVAASESEQDREGKRRELTTVSRKLDGLYDAIADGLRSPGLAAKLESLEAQKAELEEAIDDVRATAPVLLHPNLAGLYQDKVAKLAETLRAPSIRDEAGEILRDLIDEIIVTPCGMDRNDGWSIELVGNIVEMVALANAPEPRTKRAALDERTARSVKVVAGAGFEPATFRL